MKISYLPLAALVLLCLNFRAGAQPTQLPEKDAQAETLLRLEEAKIKWRNTLDQLRDEAKRLDEGDRPYALADIADAFWETNLNKAQEAFQAAFDSALALKDERSNAQARRYVMARATRRDRELGRKLLEQLFAREKNGEKISDKLGAAQDLLSDDPEAAARLLIAGATNGPSMDVAWFILSLVEKDRSLADQVYLAYLNAFSASRRPFLHNLIGLAGYAFGYGETIGGHPDPDKMSGGLGMRRKNLALNSTLAARFLDLALASAQQTLAQADTASPAEAELQHTIVFFTASYLLPEAKLYRPASEAAWLALQQRAATGTSPARQTATARKIQEALRQRANVRNPVDEVAGEMAQKDLDEAEKTAGGCERDRLYAKAAFRFNYLKDPRRAFAAAEKIADLKMENSVRQYLYYDLAEAAIRAADLENWREYLRKIEAKDRQAVLYANMAEALAQRGETATAESFLSETRQLARSLDEPATRASLLLSACATLARFKPAEVNENLYEALKAVNQLPTHNVERFTILIKADISCQGDGQWQGGGASVTAYNLYATLAALAAHDPDETAQAARTLAHHATRIRALARISQVGLQQINAKVAKAKAKT